MGRRGLGWLLALSLGVNVFFAVVAIRHRVFMHPHPPDMQTIAEFLTANLSPADAAILQASFAAYRDRAPLPQLDGAALASEIGAALTADPFDPEALRTALVKARMGRLAADDRMTDAFVDAASKISADGRSRLAVDLRRRPPPPPPDHGGGPTMIDGPPPR